MRAEIFWWVNPYKILVFFLIPIYILIYFVQFEGTVYFTTFYFITGLLFLLSISLGSLIGSRVHIKKTSPIYVYKIYLDLLFWLTFISYVIWFREFIFNPGLIIDMIVGEVNYTDIRNMISTIPGVTTLSQLGIVYIVFYMYQFKFYEPQVRKKYTIYFVIIISMTVFRSIAWSERLALIEIAVPIVVIIFSRYKKARFRSLIKTAPYVGIILMYALFSVTEYFRSWKSYYQYIYDNFFHFTAQRVLNYYYTALNNGAGFLEESGTPSYRFEHTLDWIYKFPIIGEKLSEALRIKWDYSKFLNSFLTSEFNNPSGIFVFFYDMNVPLALIFIFLIGSIIGYFYRGFLNLQGLGMLIYPVLFVGIIEIMRQPYFTSSRFFPVVLFIIFGSLLFRVKKLRK
ncbi:O-antigen polymerase [Metabacillus arenae]|uniref:Oligosaccharide repeat unit polymerase n=1 Tax=Metabacillus arenae TaxID=2771434 RepID=A0A926RY84_9BACI|nr:O-antigen polymerase [Metabacillus arenae]MBD1382683.1 oligosaccharide repeat unit polymerase [Metabacillus arenae]